MTNLERKFKDLIENPPYRLPIPDHITLDREEAKRDDAAIRRLRRQVRNLRRALKAERDLNDDGYWAGSPVSPAAIAGAGIPRPGGEVIITGIVNDMPKEKP